jgi:hypothetical protein
LASMPGCLIKANQKELKMQYAVHNCATIRVTDRTDVSGRVTADSREKQTMKPTIRRWLALVTASMGLYLGLSVCGLAQNNQGQNDQGVQLGVPNGTYAFQDSGYVTDASGNLVLLHSAGQLTFFANGKITGLSSFSVPGIPPFSRVGLSGTFKVNGDGSVSLTVTTQQGETRNFDVYPTPDGNTFTFVDTDPGTIVSGFATRGC